MRVVTFRVRAVLDARGTVGAPAVDAGDGVVAALLAYTDFIAL